MIWLYLFEGGLGLLAMGLGWLLGINPAADVAWNWPAVAWGLVATLPMAGMLPLLVHSSWPPLRRLVRLIDEVAVPLLGRLTVSHLALLSILAGVGEELMFRGLLQGGLAPYLGDAGALVAASAAFGLCHALTRTYAVLATLIGLWLGGLWLLADNLLAPMITHALYDFLALIYLLRLRR
jgi:membrane protease YdiL (CAAX protease family)